jgi:hypothetical protein
VTFGNIDKTLVVSKLKEPSHKFWLDLVAPRSQRGGNAPAHAVPRAKPPPGVAYSTARGIIHD